MLIILFIVFKACKCIAKLHACLQVNYVSDEPVSFMNLICVNTMCALIKSKRIKNKARQFNGFFTPIRLCDRPMYHYDFY